MTPCYSTQTCSISQTPMSGIVILESTEEEGTMHVASMLSSDNLNRPSSGPMKYSMGRGTFDEVT